MVGRPVIHSISQVRADFLITLRCLVVLSHIINMKNIKPTKEITEPIDDMVFHLVKESG